MTNVISKFVFNLACFSVAGANLFTLLLPTEVAICEAV